MAGIVHYLFDLDHARRSCVENPIFHIVDVFAEEKYASNQRAVFRSVGHLPDAINRTPCVSVSTGEERGRRDQRLCRKVQIVAKGELL
jgi:hypothetical protein